MKIIRTAVIAGVLCLSPFPPCPLRGQAAQKPITNDDVVRLVKAGLPADTIVLTINRSKTSFDTSPDGIIKLNQNGVTGPVLNAVLNATQTPMALPSPPVKLETSCPDKSGVYFKDSGKWRPLFQAASAGSQVKPVFGGAKSSVVISVPQLQTRLHRTRRFAFERLNPTWA